MTSLYPDMALWGFVIAILGILINIVMHICKVPKQSNNNVNWWPIIPLVLASLATILNRYASSGLAELSSQRIDSLHSKISLDANQLTQSKVIIDSLKESLSTSKKDIKAITYFMPPSFEAAKSKALFQDGKMVGVFDSCRVDRANKRMYFGTISNSNNLNPSNTVVYGKHKLRFLGAESFINLDASRPNEGRLIKNSVFEILEH